MSFGTILVYVDSAEGAGGRLRAAVDLAKAHGATLIGITAAAPRAPTESSIVEVGGGAFDLLTSDRVVIAADFAASERVFRQATLGIGLATQWRAMRNIPLAAVIEAANAADVLIVGQVDPERSDDYRYLELRELLMRSGRPLLVVPPTQRGLHVRTAVVGWKGTRDARRAIADALPALKAAEHVVLLEVNEGRDFDTSVTDAKAFLAGHGVHVRVDRIERSSFPVEKTIVEYAQVNGADLIVVGACGYERTIGWEFGNVTRKLIETSPVPCLLSH